MNNQKSGQEVLLEQMEKDISRIERKVDEGFTRMENIIQNGYVRKEEFEPIKRIVYGLVSTVLVGVLGALIALVINK